MARKSFATLFKVGGVAFLLSSLLFAGKTGFGSSNFIGLPLGEIIAVLRDVETQWMVFLCLLIYFIIFHFLCTRIESWLTRKSNQGGWNQHAAAFWLACAMLISAALYAIHYAPSIAPLTLLAGVVTGQWLAVWSKSEGRKRGEEGCINLKMLVVSLFVIFLVLAAVWNPETGHPYAYRSEPRWTGPWDGPNLFGLLMGTGTTLVAGVGLRLWRMGEGTLRIEDRGWENTVVGLKLSFLNYGVISLSLIAAFFMGRGLLHSYSRGAWMGTFCGMAYLVSQAARQKRKTEGEKSETSVARMQTGKRKTGIGGIFLISRLKRNWFSFLVVLFSTAMLIFWHFPQTDWHLARRALSSVNLMDFSWRNRAAAWEGALQVAADQPWFGVGWDRPEPLYEHYYLPPKLTESAAIQMNDYLLLGATLGIPALFSFCMYLWLSLSVKVESKKQKAEITDAEWLQTTCQAGAIVLLVGFWFDGGLFKLATASTFWILLELGNVRHEGTLADENGTKAETRISPITAN